MALFEYRVYEVAPGRLPALHARFREHTLGFFQKHGIAVVGFWEVLVGSSNELHYIVRYESMAQRESAWGAFQADEEWQAIRTASERDGVIVTRIRNQFWKAADYSPVQ